MTPIVAVLLFTAAMAEEAEISKQCSAVDSNCLLQTRVDIEIEKQDQDANGTPQGADGEIDGLSPEDAEKVKEDDAKKKVEMLSQILQHEHIGDAKNEMEVEKDLIEGKKGLDVMKGIIKVVNSVPEPIDEFNKLRVLPSDDDLVHLERYESGNPTILDPETLKGGDDPQETNATALLDTQWGRRRRRRRRRRTPPRRRAPVPPRRRTTTTIAASSFPVGYSGTRRRQKWTKGADGKIQLSYCWKDGLSSDAKSAFTQATKSLTEHCEAFSFSHVGLNSECMINVQGEANGCWANVNTCYADGCNGRVATRRDTQIVNLEDSPPSSWLNKLNKKLNKLFGLPHGTCATKGIAEHEILHVLDFSHEQKRSDRDASVTVYWQNMAKENVPQFTKDDHADKTGVYDLDSLMHYSSKAFSTNEKDTIQTANRKDAGRMGQRAGLSSEDIRQLTSWYQCAPRRRSPSAPRRRIIQDVKNWFR